MRHLNKLLCACSFAALGLPALTGCEGGELFEVNAPDWISDKIQDIEDSENGNQEEIVLEGMMEDVYTIGNTDYSSAWWTAFSKYYVIPDGQKWNAVFNLKINPDAPNTYKNFVLVICADAERGGEGYKEYGAIRFDNQPSGNSEWGDYIDRSCIESTLTFETDTDEGIEKLGGKVTLVVDRTSPEAFNVIMTNGVVTKTYKQPTALVNLNADQTNTNIRCFLVAEGSYIDFLETNIVPIEGLTSAKDKNPKSMVLQNVPQYVDAETELEKIVANVTALVTFEEEVTKTVTASELSFSEVPDMNIPGTKTLVAAYNKTFKGENCDTPILANAKFEVVEKIKSIRVKKQPIHTTYKYYTLGNTPLTGYTLAFDPTGLEVEGTDTQGKTRVLENSTLTFSGVPTEAGTQNVMVTYKEVTTTVPVQVLVSSATEVTNGSNMLGNEDNSSLWANPIYSDAFKVNAGETKYITFTNYSNLAGNWNNFLVILQSSNVHKAVVRADNYGWGDGYEACIHYGTQGVWEDWLKGMNGAKVTVFVTNNGDGTADVLSTMEGTTGQKSTQYYYGLNNMDSNNLEFMLSVDGCHLVF
ncbi:bacterial Ig-like domain-containing protein [Phocaeicola plebeius]|uniref:bacterial Ig-like domain-containing protein n=1 Tax=Phocaeicola plebeius TaxID=310297 RepID=UPI003A90F064